MHKSLCGNFTGKQGNQKDKYLFIEKVVPHSLFLSTSLFLGILILYVKGLQLALQYNKDFLVKLNEF